MEPIDLATCNIYKPDKHDLSRYWMEPKLDGFRAQIITDYDGSVRILSRSGKDMTDKVPHIRDTFKRYINVGTVVDGEFVFVDRSDPTNVHADFNKTARILGSSVNEAVRKQNESGPVTFYAFDLPYFDGFDYRICQYEIRRNRLLLAKKELGNISSDGYNYFMLTRSVEATQHNHERNVKETGEGSVLKPKHSAYGEGWLKWKTTYDADVVVMGYTTGFGKFAGQIGAVVYGQYKNDFMPVLTIRGQCSGMTDAVRRDITENESKYFGAVMEIKHMGIAANGGFRHPQFVRFRDDKLPSQCLWDNPDGTRG